MCSFKSHVHATLKPFAYSCFDPIPCTQSACDLYCSTVDTEYQFNGLGTLLLSESEARIQADGGTWVYVASSSRDDYISTRGFYEHIGYRKVAEFTDFYAPGENKVIYVKELP